MAESQQLQLIAESLQRQEQLLQKLIVSINKPVLGFHSNVGTQYVYCNRSHGYLWYTLDGNRQPIAINTSALTGYLKALKFEKVERRNKECCKLLTTIEADKTYILESGHESYFTKGLLTAIASLTPQHLQFPVTIEAVPGSDDSVLFCRIWIGSQAVRSTYGEDTKWREVALKAIANCNGANAHG